MKTDKIPGYKEVAIPAELLILICTELTTIRADLRENRKLTEEIHNMMQEIVYENK